jgi:hypothetical protein
LTHSQQPKEAGHQQLLRLLDHLRVDAFRRCAEQMVQRSFAHGVRLFAC